MIKIKLTEDQIKELSGKLYADGSRNRDFGELKDQSKIIQEIWYTEALNIIEAYNIVIKHIDFPNISIIKNCCHICRFVDVCRPAYNLRSDDINLKYVCESFESFEFEKDEEDD